LANWTMWASSGFTEAKRGERGGGLGLGDRSPCLFRGFLSRLPIGRPRGRLAGLRAARPRRRRGVSPMVAEVDGPPPRATSRGLLGFLATEPTAALANIDSSNTMRIRDGGHEG
jgi:hypothetical protein